MKDGILHLFLRHKWYDMIESGVKTEEYRDIHGWKKSLLRYPSKLAYGRRLPTHVKRICFHRGYTSRTLLRYCDGISIGIGRAEWGAPDYPCFIIKLKQQ